MKVTTKKLKTLPLPLYLGFIGSANAARDAGLALTYGFGSVAIAACLGFALLFLIKPKKDSENKKAVYYGRLFLAYALWASTLAVFPRFIINPNPDTLFGWLIPSIIFGIVAYGIGSTYGGSKKTAVKFAKKTKIVAKAAIDKSVKKPIKKTEEKPIKKTEEKPIKKTEEKPQELATEKKGTNNTMEQENINDEEFYLIATKEVIGDGINQALWAKCMAINMGDEHKSKYDYINRRVEILKKEAQVAEEKKIADAKAAEEQRIADAKAAEEQRIADAKAALEKKIADANTTYRKYLKNKE